MGRRFFGIGLLAGVLAASAGTDVGSPPSDVDVVAAFGKQGIRINGSEAAAIRDDVLLALEEARGHGIGNSKVDFAAVEIAEPPGPRHLARLERGEERRGGHPPSPSTRGHVGRPAPAAAAVEWSRYFDRTLSLWNDQAFLRLVGQKRLPAGEDQLGGHRPLRGQRLGRPHQRRGHLGARGRARPGAARLALSVRRDSNFRDKVLVVPAAADQGSPARAGPDGREDSAPAARRAGAREREPRPQRDRLEPVRDRAGARAWHARRLARGRAAPGGLHLQHLPVRLDQLRDHGRHRGQPRGRRRARAAPAAVRQHRRAEGALHGQPGRGAARTC